MALIRSLSSRLSATVGRRLQHEALWLLTGHAISLLAGLISIRLFTELAPQTVYGSANLILGMLTLGMQSLLGPITQTQVRYHSQYKLSGAADAYTWAISKLALSGATIVAIGMTGLLCLWPALRLGSNSTVIGWLAIWIGVSAWRGVAIGRIQAERQQQRYASWIGVEAIMLTVATGGILWFWPSVEGYISGQVLGIALPACCFARQPRSASQFGKVNNASANDVAKVQRMVWVQVTTYGFPFATFALLGWLSSLSDRYILAFNLDLAAVGQYVAAFGIASRLPSVVGGLMNDLFRPVLFEAANRGDIARGDRIFTIWIVCLSAAVAGLLIVLYVGGEFVADLLLAEGYRAQAGAIMGWIAAGFGCVALAQVVENRLLSFDASRILIWTKLSGAASNFIVALLVVPGLGVIGAALANATGQATMLLATVIAYRAVSKKVRNNRRERKEERL